MLLPPRTCETTRNITRIDEGGITRGGPMRERRRDYELLFIVSPLRSSEEEISNTVNRVRQAIAGAGGEMTDVDQSPLGDAANLPIPFANMLKVRPAAARSTRASMCCATSTWPLHAFPRSSARSS